MRKFTTQDQIELAYHDQGTGPVILCLPGLTRNHYDFDDFIKVCDLPARIISLTSRGRYPSQYDENWVNYSVAQEAGDVISFLDHLNIERAMIIGTSRGGLISMLLSVTHPNRLASVVLNDIGPVIDQNGLDRIKDALGHQPDWNHIDEAISAIKLRLASQFPKLDDEIWRMLAMRWYRFFGDAVLLNYDPNLIKNIESPQAPVDLWPFFEAMSTRPLGLVWGKNSDLLSADTVKFMREKNPALLVAELEDRGHVPFLNEPKALKLITTIFTQSFAS